VRFATILIVDDEACVCEVASRILRLAGYTTLTASDGPDALLAVELNGPVDLLVTDLMMPLMQGDELARQLRRRLPRLRVLYLTGHSQLLFGTAPILAEHEAFLDKPFTSDGLLEAVSLLLFGHRRGCREPLL
jgi:CheY-like chemotaxis protein